MSYVHGYDERESERLHDQAGALVELLHGDTAYPAGARVLEAGCGVGAQTVTLSARSPKARFTSIDVSAESLAGRAPPRVCANVEFRAGRHLRAAVQPRRSTTSSSASCSSTSPDPVAALARLKTHAAPGGTITVIEGDHGSAYFHPDSAAAHDAIAVPGRRSSATRAATR